MLNFFYILSTTPGVATHSPIQQPSHPIHLPQLFIPALPFLFCLNRMGNKWKKFSYFIRYRLLALLHTSHSAIFPCELCCRHIPECTGICQQEGWYNTNTIFQREKEQQFNRKKGERRFQLGCLISNGIPLRCLSTVAIGMRWGGQVAKPDGYVKGVVDWAMYDFSHHIREAKKEKKKKTFHQKCGFFLLPYHFPVNRRILMDNVCEGVYFPSQRWYVALRCDAYFPRK